MFNYQLKINGKWKDFWIDQPNPPSEAQAMEAKRLFLAANPRWGMDDAPAPKASSTGRMPERSISGRLPGGPVGPGSYAPVQPFGPEMNVEDEITRQPVAKQQVKSVNPALAAAAAFNPAAAAQMMGAKPGAQKKVPQRPLPKAPPVNLLPKTGAQVLAEQNTPQARAKYANQAIEAKKNAPLESGSVTIPVIGEITWIKRGPGYEANIPGVGVVKGGTRQILTKKVNEAIKANFEQIKTRQASPNLTDVVPDQNAIPPNVQRPGTTGQQLIETYGKLNPNERDKKDAFNREVSEIGKTLGSVAAMAAPGGQANAFTDLVGQAAASVLTSPANIAMELETIKSDRFTNEEKAGAVFNLLASALTASATPFGPSLIDDAAKLLKGGDKFAKALDNLPLEPNQRAAVEQFVKDNPNLTFKGFENGKPKFTAKAGSRTIPDPNKSAVSKPGFEVTPEGVTQKIGEKAIWRNQDVDTPINLTGKVETHTDGRKFAEIELDGQKSWVPDDEVIREVKAEAPNTEAPKATVEAPKVEPPAPPKVETPKTKVEEPDNIGGMRMADIESAAVKLGITLPDRKTFRRSHAQQMAEALKNREQIDKSVGEALGVENPSLTSEERFIVKLKTNEISGEIDKLTEKIKLERNPEIKEALQGQMDAQLKEVERLSQLAYKSNSNKGRELNFLKAMVGDDFDADRFMLKAERLSSGNLTNATRTKIINLTESGKRVRATVEAKMRKQAESALDRIRRMGADGITAKDVAGCK